jgi:bifunctional NMN adenylyltransferase/nudix hydrolase
MEEIKKTYDIGVIIGRFQIHELHSEHQKVIEHVLDRHDKVIVLLGISQSIHTRRNPLDFVSRKMMLEELYGDNISAILPLHDKKSNHRWAKQVDDKVREVFPMGSAVVYGSRDSFIPFYTPYGSFDCIELEAEKKVSASEIRKSVKNRVLRSKEFRAGMIYAANQTFPFNYATIDVAIFNDDYTKVLLGRKKFEDEFRFVGGFSDVEDQSWEQTVKREATEETGLEVGGLEYVCSRKVEDWRYRGEADRAIMTTFFMAKRIFGAETAQDDIEEVKWFNLNDLKVGELVTEHNHLLKALQEKVNSDAFNEAFSKGH